MWNPKYDAQAYGIGDVTMKAQEPWLMDSFVLYEKFA